MSLLGLDIVEELMGREELLVELTKYKKLKAELKEMVECPVDVVDSELHLLLTMWHKYFYLN